MVKKKSQVYVKTKAGKVKRVPFGDPKMRIRKSNKKPENHLELDIDVQLLKIKQHQDIGLARRGKMARKKRKTRKRRTKSRVNEAGNYTKPTMRKRLFQKIKAGSKGGRAGQWSARKAQMLARQYKAKGGGYR